MLLAVPYLYAASLPTVLIENGAPGWFHLVVVLWVWNALKFVVLGPVSLVLLLRARTAEWRDHRALRRSTLTAV